MPTVPKFTWHSVTCVCKKCILEDLKLYAWEVRQNNPLRKPPVTQFGEANAEQDPVA